jgi:hypothetical protein
MMLTRRVERLDRRLPHGADSTTSLLTLRFDSATDVLAILDLAAAVAVSDRAAEPIERARALAHIAGVALKALQVRDLEARVEALERVLRMRGRGR